MMCMKSQNISYTQKWPHKQIRLVSYPQFYLGFNLLTISIFYHCKISKVRDHELHEVYREMCIDGNLKDEHKHLEEIGLVHELHVPKEFNENQIGIVLRRVHDMHMYLDYPIKSTKDVCYMVTIYHVAKKVKTIQRT